MKEWKERYEAYKKGMGYINKDIAYLLDRKVNSIEVSVSRESLPDTFKLAIITYETMLENGQIVYNRNEHGKAEGGKE